jgi:hypothetical protein
MGLRPPLTDWTIDRESLCLSCAAKNPELAPEMVGKIIADQNDRKENVGLRPA